MAIGDLLKRHYERLWNGCENAQERELLNCFYRQLNPNNHSHIELFLSLRTQVKAINNRRFRLDFGAILPDGRKVAIEYEGGCYSRGAASIGYRSIGGYRRHVEKYNTLAAMGWFVFRFQNDKAQTSNVWAVIGL